MKDYVLPGSPPRLTPGWYRLTKDLPALRPDRRKRHDWTAAPIPAGTMFAVRDEPEYGRGFRSIYSGRYACECLSVDNPLLGGLLPFLVPVADTPSRWLDREHTLSAGAGILDALVESGRLTLVEIQTVKESLNKKASS